jgi:alkyl hydroperoxide reductase subunit AhpF
MSLLAPADQEQLRHAFSEMTASVRLLFFTQTIDCETCLMTRQILDELPPLSDRIAIEEVNFVLDKDKAAQYGIDRVPAIAVLGDNGGGEAAADSRIRFLGAPSGHEFVSLVRAIRLVGGGGSSLTEDNRRRIAAVDTPVTMRVFTTPT